MGAKPSFENFRRDIKNIIRVCYCFLILLCVFPLVLLASSSILKEKSSSFDIYFNNYDVSMLSDSPEALEIQKGFELFNKTYKLLGKEAMETPYVGNSLSCTNCHLQNGTAPFAMPMIGVNKRFPQYRGREDKIGNLKERINGCFERSMNGRKLPDDSKEMNAFIAYIGWLSRFVAPDEIPGGKGLKSIEIPNRAVNLDQGKIVFERACVECHGSDGQGKKLDATTYEYPALWGKQAYNNGAGMTRVITAAQFIKYNMPFGTTYEAPLLTDAEAYDVAGYINQQTRPVKTNLAVDFPNRKKKPVSTPYPPYADSFPVKQHQLGPFQPIMTYYKETYNINKSK